MLKAVGRAWLQNGKWHITAQPHIVVFLKRLFPRLKSSLGTFKIDDTPENAANLHWFDLRYPLDIRPRERLDQQNARYLASQAELQRIESPDYVPQVRPLSLPLRTYQGVAVDVLFGKKALLLGDDVGLGKQHPIDTRILTPEGWRAIGDLAVGDKVIGSDGGSTTVTGVFPQGVKPSYRMLLSDGSSVESGPDHLWTVAYWSGGRRLAEVVATTEQIRTGSIVPTGANKSRLFVPLLSGSVNFHSPLSLPIPPYTLGQLIANGCLGSHGTALTVNSSDWGEIESRLREEGARIGNVHVYGGATRAGISGLSAAIRSIGLNTGSASKRIPEAYQRAAAVDRVALLQGLMDGDGSISKERNRVTYHTTSAGLAADVRQLVEALGGIATVRQYDRGDECKPTEFQVRMRLPRGVSPFFVSRKASRHKPGFQADPKRSIVSVEYVRDVESVCIAVDAPDALYATEHCILTHNTAVAIGAMASAQAMPALVVTYAHLQTQWEREIRRFLPSANPHIIRSKAIYTPKGYCKPDVWITTYSKIADWALTLAGQCKLLVLDEIQELRRTDSDKYRGAKQLASKIPYRLGLSATPIYNQGGEVWSVMDILQPGCLGEKQEFAAEWCMESGSDVGKWVVKNPQALGAYLRSEHLFLRRTREEVGRQLPAISRYTQAIDADLSHLDSVAGQAGELAKMLLANDQRGRGEDMQTASEFVNLLRRQTGLSKAPSVAAFVNLLLEQGEPVILGGWHHAVYDVWRELLGKHNPVFYTGKESDQAKAQAKDKFLSGGTNLLVLSLRSGVGLDGLQGRCRNVVFGELDWSPGPHKQFIGRVHRDGQPLPVFAYFLYCNSGSDPIMMETLGLKDSQAKAINDPWADGAEVLDNAAEQRAKRLAMDYLKARGQL